MSGYRYPPRNCDLCSRSFQSNLWIQWCSFCIEANPYIYRIRMDQGENPGWDPAAVLPVTGFNKYAEKRSGIKAGRPI